MSIERRLYLRSKNNGHHFLRENYSIGFFSRLGNKIDIIIKKLINIIRNP